MRFASVRTRTLCTAVAIGSLVATADGCSSSRGRTGPPPPRAEFLLSTADSTFWVKTGAGETEMRGAPLTLASYDGHYYELYTTDDDFSYDDALLLGERLYRRDLVTDDSVAVFADTIVPRIAAAYAKTHPDERPLDPDEEGEANPKTSATAEVDVLDVFGPYLSYEYRVDVEAPGMTGWHATRRGVLDLRTGKPAYVGDLFGDSVAMRVTSTARRNFEILRDSVSRMRSTLSGKDLRAADAVARLSFDERSFTLSNAGGEPGVTFGIPVRGGEADGSIVELDPVKAAPLGWWQSVAGGLATEDDADNDRWNGSGYGLIARYDTSGEVAHLSIADAARREWPIGSALAPLRRIDWLDRPSISSAMRRALSRAFDEASNYDENSRVASLPSLPLWRGATNVSIRFASNHHASRDYSDHRNDFDHARHQERQGESARNVGADDAWGCQQSRARVRRRGPVADGQDRGDRRLSPQSRQCGHGIYRSSRLSRADLPR